MLYKKAAEMTPTPIPNCMGGEGTVMMERLLDAPAEMLGKGRAYVRHTLAPGVSIGKHTHEHEMESMVIVKGRARHIMTRMQRCIILHGCWRPVTSSPPCPATPIRLPAWERSLWF